MNCRFCGAIEICEYKTNTDSWWLCCKKLGDTLLPRNEKKIEYPNNAE